jgi:hypothetical protein
VKLDQDLDPKSAIAKAIMWWEEGIKIEEDKDADFSLLSHSEKYYRNNKTINELVAISKKYPDYSASQILDQYIKDDSQRCEKPPPKNIVIVRKAAKEAAYQSSYWRELTSADNAILDMRLGRRATEQEDKVFRREFYRIQTERTHKSRELEKEEARWHARVHSPPGLFQSLTAGYTIKAERAARKAKEKELMDLGAQAAIRHSKGLKGFDSPAELLKFTLFLSQKERDLYYRGYEEQAKNLGKGVG